ncbi:hypothetical protein G7085_12895 [Tessaracoccus sp. HDW20]|uniref:hypothetical protein n=1 Tax=Tessaracoccus coleopterorum TaxID=2714950 RepID=UPI0018D48FB2|nr:hypothetical protein [Tessaracoccus coleopterorum]NHB85221.1 hypothetical protein [Tessaracoccus coleopterorum]
MSPLIEAAVYAPADGSLRRWSCPRCLVQVDRFEPPAGWLVFRPFDRVAACVDCRDGLIADLATEGIIS